MNVAGFCFGSRLPAPSMCPQSAEGFVFFSQRGSWKRGRNSDPGQLSLGKWVPFSGKGKPLRRPRVHPTHSAERWLIGPRTCHVFGREASPHWAGAQSQGLPMHCLRNFLKGGGGVLGCCFLKATLLQVVLRRIKGHHPVSVFLKLETSPNIATAASKQY